jgi:diguanylate cyclase (GGDEF)-like protein/PAS domain S-box-containing protein
MRASSGRFKPPGASTDAYVTVMSHASTSPTLGSRSADATPGRTRIWWNPARTGQLAWCGLAAVLLFVSAFGGWVGLTTRDASDRVRGSSGLSDAYEQARYAVGAEESLERKYRIEPGAAVLASHRSAAAGLEVALGEVRRLGSAEDTSLVDDLLAAHAAYVDATARMFLAVDSGDMTRVGIIDQNEVDPIFEQIGIAVDAAANAHRARALEEIDRLGQTQRTVLTTTPVVFVVGFALLVLFWLVLHSYQRRLDESGTRELFQARRNEDQARQSAEQLRRNEERFRVLVQNGAEFVAILDRTGTLTYASPSAEALLGATPEAIVGTALLAYVHPDDAAAVKGTLNDVLSQSSTNRRAEFRVRHVGASWRQVEAICRNLMEEPAVSGLVLNVRDITERKQAEEALRHMALHDELTGLPNRTLLQDRMAQAILAARRGNSPLTLLLVDLDRFKEINDTFGHEYGDLLLEQIGPRLRGVLRTSDTVARLGGDEFGILLPTTDAESGAAVAQQVLRILEAPFELDDQRVEIGASIGVASYPLHGDDAATLLRGADVAMYVAKRGETGVVVYSTEQDHYSAERLALGSELRLAVENHELLLHFQPKLDMRDGTLVGVEALVRWQHPLRGFLPPGEFIPLAEQTGLIYALTEWVLKAALRQHEAWRQLGLDIPVAVNLSRRTLHDPRLPEMVAALLDRYGMPPSALVLEITESSLMADPLRAGENLTQLRAQGVQISIDDFGSGYSSLDSLKNLSVDELKIDQSFVQAMATDSKARAIVRAIIDLADALELRVVAEGVEDGATWDVLAGLGCDVAQGYFLSRPIDATELEAWLTDVSPSWLAAASGSGVDVALQLRIRGRGARLTAEEEFVARKHAEASLFVSEERNRLALQAAGMGTWDWDAIHDVQIWSAETQALHGLAPGTFEGTFAAFKRAVHPDDWPAFEVELLASQAERRPSIVTYRAVWPDGTVRWLENQGLRPRRHRAARHRYLPGHYGAEDR